MNGCLNILWHFPFFGFLFAFFYALFGAILCCTVVLYPVGLGFFQIARFLLTPFSSALVTRKELDLVRPEERSTAAVAFSTVITILYFPFGLIAAAGALFAMIGEFLSIIGIPCGIVWFKALPAIFMPVDRICVPKAVADEIARIKAGDTVRRYKGETGEPEPHSAERHFTEDPGETLPPMPEVRQYDDEKLHEIVSGAAMYRASLVEECRRELEIRSRSTEFTAQVRAMDNDKLHEVLASPQLYAEELIYACTLEQAERRRVWREEQAKEAEKLRLRREQEEKEAAERRAAAWKRYKPYVIAGAVAILIGIGFLGKYIHENHQDIQDGLYNLDAYSCYEKGRSFAYGYGNTPYDMSRAIKWYIQAAKKGCVEAQNELGQCYELGDGTRKNLKKAYLYYRMAAENGFATAQVNLAECYQKGKGVEKDLAEAIYWYQKAANQGNEMGRQGLLQCR